MTLCTHPQILIPDRVVEEVSSCGKSGQQMLSFTMLTLHFSEQGTNDHNLCLNLS
jgi:hypothetical protein